MKRLITILGAAALALTAAPATVFAGNGLGITGHMHDRSAGKGQRVSAGVYRHYAACQGAPTDPVPEEDAITTRKQCEDAGFTWTSGVPADGWAQGEICRICHSPHDYNQDYYTAGLLWNRAVNNDDYLMYAPKSSQIGGSDPDGVAGGAEGPSKLCLSCHDGTIAIDVRYGVSDLSISTTRTVSRKRTDDGMIDLRGTHPISIAYPDPGEQGIPGGFNPTDTPVETTLSYNTKYTANTSTVAAVSSGTISDVLYNGKVECSSCHDVHNSEGVSVPFSPILRVAQNMRSQGGERASGLCLTCHNK